MIPRKIHYCWFGENQLSDLNKRCIDSWPKNLPDYEFKLWNETNAPVDNDYARAAIKTRSWSKVIKPRKISSTLQ
jgi:mannosyltransferase OCH1-like enzyme